MHSSLFLCYNINLPIQASLVLGSLRIFDNEVALFPNYLSFLAFLDAISFNANVLQITEKYS